MILLSIIFKFNIQCSQITLYLLFLSNILCFHNVSFLWYIEPEGKLNSDTDFKKKSNLS